MSGLVQGLDTLSDLLDLLIVSSNDLVLNTLLLSADIDFFSVVLVLRLEIIQCLE